MSRYFRVSPSYWDLSKDWPDREVVVGLYVQTCRHRNSEGLYHLPKEYAAADLGYSPAAIAKALAALTDVGLVKYDAKASVILLLNAFETQVPTTVKQVAGAINRIRMVPASPLLWDLYSLANAHANALAEAIAKEFPNSIPMGNGKPFESSVALSSFSNSTAEGQT